MIDISGYEYSNTGNDSEFDTEFDSTIKEYADRRKKNEQKKRKKLEKLRRVRNELYEHGLKKQILDELYYFGEVPTKEIPV